MNGVHDMGGMQGFGPIHPEKGEPVFHARWEGRLMAMRRAIAATGKLNRRGGRPFIESLPAAEYLSSGYYEQRYVAVTEHWIASGVVTRQEVESGRPANGSVRGVPTLKPAEAARLPYVVPRGMLNVAVTPRFSVGQHVRARNIHPSGHTRLPRYARGRAGIIEWDRGVQAFPDTDVYERGENPQHVYSVRFAARELWGEQASSRDAVYIELWENYLESA
jgi:nitrile hydratase beta subunit